MFSQSLLCCEIYTIHRKGYGKYIFCCCYLRHSQGFISSGMLHMQDGFPHLTVKAWNGQVLLVFLDRCLTALVAAGAQDQEIQLAHLATRAMTCWFDRLARFPQGTRSQILDFDFCASTGSWRFCQYFGVWRDGVCCPKCTPFGT